MSEDNGHGVTVWSIVICVCLTILACYVYFCRPDIVSRMTVRTDAAGDGGKAAELTQEIADMQEKMDGLQARLVDAESTISRKDGEIKSGQSRIDGLKAAAASLGQQNKALSERLAGQPDYKKEYEKEKDRFRLSLGVSAGSPLYSFRPEATASVGIGRGNWQVLTGVGYSADGPKLSLGFQWTF